MREIPAKLQAARREDIAPEHLPVLPDWFPRDSEATDEREAVTYTDDQRRAAREEARFTEARRGPLDGSLVMVNTVGAPPEVLQVFDGWAYRLQDAESKPDWLVYRYSPRDSTAHAKTMGQVETTYLEHGPGYVEQAQQQDAVHDGIDVERVTHD